ncbi:molybdopterin-guanine dinucleotide biosynthesis protein B [Sporosarcina sp. P37]|uniref:molybdopterin-guanine dinucleotide biosynthesis protein B n=1 Tax=unclassified Sporosarcina TaxID=2647733 RepID=UPI000A17C155|nr:MULTISPECIES: molybdopterin-guanine dinucleotide biosynthesis protein B [unclassified Sporosarcina]ARK25196.1 molybdopterin-guanine dinucleotide biosynthesis protein B [Sporosarcina sp. P37]PID17487.1 molybdopterin-guanine dinucleotide biosynthesis protein B [Sporosarcina sp. P35]
MGTVKTLHIVGFKNSGKTTLVSHWISVLKRRGLDVAVLKHHGHGGEPELPPAHTDTVQFLQSGAVSTLVAGGDMIQLIQNKERSFEQLKTLASSGKPDVLLIEGYKQEAGEKVVLIRNEEERKELESLPGIIQTADSADLFSDITLLDNWLQEWVEARQ